MEKLSKWFIKTQLQRNFHNLKLSLITWRAPFACCVKTQMPLYARSWPGYSSTFTKSTLLMRTPFSCWARAKQSCSLAACVKLKTFCKIIWFWVKSHNTGAFARVEKASQSAQSPYLQGTGTTVITKAVFPGFGLHCTLEGWFPRVPQNLGARCAIFGSRADLRSRS